MKYKNLPILEALKNAPLIEVRAGKEREKFTQIWIVNVGDRLFARSWSLSERSWFTTLLNDGTGEIKIGKNIFTVKGFVPKDVQSMHPRINSSYLLRYDDGENSYYARGITQPKYYDRTMEFELVER